ncbi:MAG: amidohydrolase [Proteobacteria bacterium]|nr:amidohydrolase [Pseudomonadota bacterium]
MSGYTERCLWLMVVTVLFLPGMLRAESTSGFLRKDKNYLVEVYKDLHAHPELSLKEKETSKRMAQELEKAGFDVTRGVGGYGVVGVLKNGRGPTVMVRADMDALPVTEETGLAYASRATDLDADGAAVGVMHACGHDMHMTVLIGTARLLARFKSQWRGTLVMVAQPAEEIIKGAESMITDGLFTRFPRPDYVLGLHIMPMPNFLIGYREAYYWTGVSTLNVTVRGVGGHGARPHTTKDPIVMAAQMILGFQTIVSREIDPVEPAVVTVGSIHGGTASNIVPEAVEMKLTIRAFPDDLRQKIVASVKRIANSIALANDVPEGRMPVFAETGETPAIYNDPKLTRRLLKLFEDKFGKSRLYRHRLTSSDDFAYYRLAEPKIPTFYFGIGAYSLGYFNKGRKNGDLPSIHSPRFAPDKPKASIGTGVKAMSAAVMELLKKKDSSL